jgi:cyclophilin family peptidyl-prolyl cis-trans isomerase
VFGEVVQGMEVVDKIAEVEAASRGLFPKCPVEPVIIQTVKRLN